MNSKLIIEIEKYQKNEIIKIFGPSGSGKTFKLLEIIEYLINFKKENILIIDKENEIFKYFKTYKIINKEKILIFNNECLVTNYFKKNNIEYKNWILIYDNWNDSKINLINLCFKKKILIFQKNN